MWKPAQFEIGPNVWTHLTRRRRPWKRRTSCYEYRIIISSSSRPVEPLGAWGGKQSFESIRHTAWRRIFPAPRYQHYQLLKISLSFIFLSLYILLLLLLLLYLYLYRTLCAHCSHIVTFSGINIRIYAASRPSGRLFSCFRNHKFYVLRGTNHIFSAE